MLVPKHLLALKTVNPIYSGNSSTRYWLMKSLTEFSELLCTVHTKEDNYLKQQY